MMVRVTTFYALSCKYLSCYKTAVDTDRFMHFICAGIEANVVIIMINSWMLRKITSWEL
jgi:hypothetical protein